MCTFIMLYQILEDYPVIALHNRYLRLNTQEEAPKTQLGGVYCPSDLASKGTWIGLNRDGLMIAITNQETHSNDVPRRSRGILALDVLRECGSSAEAKKYLTDPSIRGYYRPGNFVVADHDEAWHVLWDHFTTAWRIVPGSYSVGTVTMYPGISLDERAEKIGLDSEKRRIRALKLLDGYDPVSLDEVIEKIKVVSSDHEYGKTTASICWHSTEFKQTSSTIIAVGLNPFESRVLYCVGNACESKFREYTISFN